MTRYCERHVVFLLNLTQDAPEAHQHLLGVVAVPHGTWCEIRDALAQGQGTRPFSVPRGPHVLENHCPAGGAEGDKNRTASSGQGR